MAKPRKLTRHAVAALKALAGADSPQPIAEIVPFCDGSNQNQIKTALAALRRRGFAKMAGSRNSATWSATAAGKAEAARLAETPAELAPMCDTKTKAGRQLKQVLTTFKPARHRAKSIEPTLITEAFLPAIAGDGSLLLFEGRDNQPAIERSPYRIPRDHARALVAFLRTLPDSHELSLPT